MKTVSVVLLLFVFGLPTGHSLKCYICEARDGEFCEGEVTECSEGSRCMTVSEIFKCNHTYKSIQKRCSMNVNCSADMYAYVDDNVKYDLSHKCCDTDLCNNGIFSMPNKTYPNNGPECPICALFNTSERCTPVLTTICRQATDQCAYLVGLLRKPDGHKSNFSVQGCMSYESCKYDYSQTPGYKMERIDEMSCWLPKPETKPPDEKKEVDGS